MPFPRVPKIARTEVDWEPVVLFPGTDHPPDPFELGPSKPWAHLERRFPKPDRLLRTDASGQVHDLGDGKWAIHAYLSPDSVVVSHDMERLFELDREGAERVLWQGPRLRMAPGSAVRVTNWMFGAVPLPDGRLLVKTPDLDDPAGGPDTWPVQVTLLDAKRNALSSLRMPLRSPSAAKKKRLPRRYTAEQMAPACDGRVVVLAETEILAVGIYGNRLAFVGKGTMPRNGGDMRSDGRTVRVSNDLSGDTYRWFRLENLSALWTTKA